ncbi:response regulator [Croceicoccus sp. YJ47]|uniref:response regulator n=1 Tax=Croceicoccus sp. YJ47 TaxID=2798724 RepID=UPI001F367BA0|nr:response regulator [Croceicoccus sp. YJ47]
MNIEAGDHGEPETASPYILLVEDEMIIAFDLVDRLEDCGFTVDGPHPSIVRALAAIETRVPDGAVLDVQLTDGVVFPVADRLRDMAVPFVFHSGHASPEELQERYPRADVCTKPCPIGTLESRLQKLVVSRK